VDQRTAFGLVAAERPDEHADAEVESLEVK
jgi:hypothetical protein